MLSLQQAKGFHGRKALIQLFFTLYVRWTKITLSSLILVFEKKGNYEMKNVFSDFEVSEVSGIPTPSWALITTSE